MDIKKVAAFQGMKLHLRRTRKILVDKGLFKISKRSTNPTFVHVVLVYNSYNLHKYLLLIDLIDDYSHTHIIKVLDMKKQRCPKRKLENQRRIKKLNS